MFAFIKKNSFLRRFYVVLVHRDTNGFCCTRDYRRVQRNLLLKTVMFMSVMVGYGMVVLGSFVVAFISHPVASLHSPPHSSHMISPRRIQTLSHHGTPQTLFECLQLFLFSCQRGLIGVSSSSS